MKIIIENPSSPGASFTDNTNSVIIECYEWVIQNENKIDSFSNFRKELTSYKGVNADNARNIYPLLKNCGFVNYTSRGLLPYKDFFTQTGLGYVKALLLINKLIDSNDNKSVLALKKVNQLKEELIFQGIVNLIVNADTNYNKELYEMIRYVVNLDRINKYEFAYLLYELNNSSEVYSDSFRNTIAKFRNNDINIDLKIRVRTGINDDSSFTSYTYFSALLCQAGILVKGDNNYLYLNSSKKVKCEQLLKEANYE